MTRTPWKRNEGQPGHVGPGLTIAACLFTLLLVWAPIAWRALMTAGCNPATTWATLCRWGS